MAVTKGERRKSDTVAAVRPRAHLFFFRQSAGVSQAAPPRAWGNAGVQLPHASAGEQRPLSKRQTRRGSSRDHYI